MGNANQFFRLSPERIGAANIGQLYARYPQLADENKITWSEAINKAALENIHRGKFDVTNDIEPNLFNATWQILNGAVNTAFGDVAADSQDFDFVNELKYNNGVFAAFKTHRQQNELTALLVDDEGNARSYGEFEKACRPTLDGYNRNWLQTEYNTATTRARFAANVKNFERDAKHFPNMRWTPSRSAEIRPEHEQFYGLVLPINDPFWAAHFPGNLYNCKCGIEQTDEPAHQRPKVKTEPVPGLDTNPAETGALFSNSHPYFDIAKPKFLNLLAIINTKIGDKLITYTKVKEFKNGGKLLQSSLFNHTVLDAKDIKNIGLQFAKQGKQVIMNPTMLHYKDERYDTIFGGLKNTPYYRKCPDLLVDSNYYEFESFAGKFDKSKIKKMLRHGAQQADKIIINSRGGSSDEFILNRVNDQLKNGVIIKEVWLWNGKLLRQLF